MPSIIEIKSKKGIKYKAYVQVRGYAKKAKIFTKKTEAKNWAMAIESAMKNGTYKEMPNGVIFEDGTSIKTLGELIDYFKKNEAPNRYSYVEKYYVMYEWWKNKIGNLKCNEVTPSVLSDCKRILINEDAIKKQKGNEKRGSSTINKYLMALSAILTFGKKEYGLWEINPMHDVEKRKLPDLRTRFLSENEIKIIKKGSRKKSYRLYVFVMLGLTTGARYSEILNLKVENIDFKNNRVHYLNTKNKTNRGVPINKKLAIKIKVLMKIKKISKGYLFLNDKKTKLVYMKGHFEGLIEELKIEDFHFHDLRHTAASHLLMNGATIIELMEIFGWTSQAMARRYAHVSKTHTTGLMNTVSSMMLSA